MTKLLCISEADLQELIEQVINDSAPWSKTMRTAEEYVSEARIASIGVISRAEYRSISSQIKCQECKLPVNVPDEHLIAEGDRTFSSEYDCPSNEDAETEVCHNCGQLTYSARYHHGRDGWKCNGRYKW